MIYSCRRIAFPFIVLSFVGFGHYLSLQVSNSSFIQFALILIKGPAVPGMNGINSTFHEEVDIGKYNDFNQGLPESIETSFLV